MNNKIVLSPQTAFVYSCKEIIAEHTSELTIRRNQLTRISVNGGVNDRKWIHEVGFFIGQILEPQVGSGLYHFPGCLDTVRNLIEAATVHYLSSRICFSLDNSHIPYERLVSHSLSDLGWQTQLIYIGNDDRAAVMAEMRDKRVLIQCRHYASSIGILAIESAEDRRLDREVACAAIVSDGHFTDRARQLASSRAVVLLHHNHLMELEERIFGTDAWRLIPPRTIQVEASGQPPFYAETVVANAA
jgi:hypothetical protein